jgi:DNA polymerase-3 subunit chi
MTEVNFHHGATDPIEHACRLLWKAQQQGAAVTVCGADDSLTRLDAALWTFEPLAFVPHARLRAGQPMPARLMRTPIWLVDHASEAPASPVLVNLGPQIAAGFESFERLFEIVGRDEAARQSGRQRWRHLQSRGYRIESHECR